MIDDEAPPEDQEPDVVLTVDDIMRKEIDALASLLNAGIPLRHCLSSIRRLHALTEQIITADDDETRRITREILDHVFRPPEPNDE